MDADNLTKDEYLKLLWDLTDPTTEKGFGNNLSMLMQEAETGVPHPVAQFMGLRSAKIALESFLEAEHPSPKHNEYINKRVKPAVEVIGQAIDMLADGLAEVHLSLQSCRCGYCVGRDGGGESAMYN